MRLKEIKPGMAIHCKNYEEKKALLEEAERLGYKWSNTCVPTDSRMVEIAEMTIHFYGKSEYANFKHITWSNNTKGVTEFSDLIMPELTAEEAIKLFGELCIGSCQGCPLHRVDDYENCFSFCFDNPEKAVELLAQWKANHEKKEPEIETVDICRIIEVLPDGRKRCVHEEDIKPDPELPYGSEQIAVHETLKRYCMEHDGEFIAVHEVVSRVKAVE